jgi:serine/threonine protein kinase
MSFQFVILRRLPSGGNGDLFIGKRTDTGEFVVIKYLREWQFEHARRGFAREIRVLGRGVQGVVTLLGADMAARPPFYVMPYLSGGSLTRYAGRLTENQLHAIATEIALALAALRAAYIKHGDVKPDNVLVSDDGRLKVADPLGGGVGCTMLFSENHGGTQGYWAPEIRAGGPISYAGDVRSYGAMLYEMVTGRKPQDDQPLCLTQQERASASKICEIIVACCQIEPDSRPTMQEVLRMLRGERWADIQVERKQSQDILTAVCVIGTAVLVGKALAS